MAQESMLAHHFHNLEQQNESHSMGMWLFLATEVMFFSGLFFGYAAYFYAYPVAFTIASQQLNLVVATINTVILLTSSLTVALAMRSMQMNDKTQTVRYMLATIVLGAVFLVLKGYEYFEKYLKSEIPGPYFYLEGAPRETQLFFSLYFATTGLHALHMIIGIVLLAMFTWWVWKGWFTAERFQPLENMGLYWHFVDVAWVFIFPLYYLIDRYGIIDFGHH